MDLKAAVEAGSESANSLKESAAQVVEDASALAAQAVAAAKEQSGPALEAASEAGASLRRTAAKPVVLGVAALAAAGVGFVVWKRRRDAAVTDLSGETPWEAPSGAKVGEAASEAPKSYAAQLDDVAHVISDEVVDSIEVPEEGVPGI